MAAGWVLPILMSQGRW